MFQEGIGCLLHWLRPFCRPRFKCCRRRTRWLGVILVTCRTLMLIHALNQYRDHPAALNSWHIFFVAVALVLLAGVGASAHLSDVWLSLKAGGIPPALPCEAEAIQSPIDLGPIKRFCDSHLPSKCTVILDPTKTIVVPVALNNSRLVCQEFWDVGREGGR